MTESPVELLAKTHPNLEIWWDSSPLIFEQWVQEMLAAASPHRRATLEAQLRRLYVAEDPARSVLRGCTTNLSPDQFNAHPSAQFMLGMFSKAAEGLEEYVGGRMAQVRGL